MKYPDIICVDCGAVTSTKSKKRILCDACATKRTRVATALVQARKRAERPTKMFACERCGSETTHPGSGDPKYCDRCRPEVRREQGRAHDARRRPALIIGSIRACCECGKDFLVTGPRREACDNCIAQFNMKRSARWAKDNRDSVLRSAKSYNDKRRATPRGKLEWAMRSGIRRGLSPGSTSGQRTFDLLSFDVDSLRLHIERQFEDGMSWNNFGEWHIDHRVPLTFFEYSTPQCQDFKAAWALTNLQPLWAPDNLSKGGRRTLLL